MASAGGAWKNRKFYKAGTITARIDLKKKGLSSDVQRSLYRLSRRA